MSMPMLGRDFIKMICPLLGVKQEKIRKMHISAPHDDRVIIDIECFAIDGGEISIKEIDIAGEMEARRFIVDVVEIKLQPSLKGQNLTQAQKQINIGTK